VRVTATAYVEFQVSFNMGKDGTPKVHYSPQTQLFKKPKKEITFGTFNRAHRLFWGELGHRHI